MIVFLTSDTSILVVINTIRRQWHKWLHVAPFESCSCVCTTMGLIRCPFRSLLALGAPLIIWQCTFVTNSIAWTACQFLYLILITKLPHNFFTFLINFDKLLVCFVEEVKKDVLVIMILLKEQLSHRGTVWLNLKKIVFLLKIKKMTISDVWTSLKLLKVF